MDQNGKPTGSADIITIDKKGNMEITSKSGTYIIDATTGKKKDKPKSPAK